ncbi:MAG: hypothetical protein A3F84_05510 [Candidatus Handelsmanbacteria bacterium RIFCSPLOWO2_12_FULL_64_10]|uniref:Outer membrane protein beta-barrel domain-containing protein n=1 Tax=Handelsmanbacteria sp. (strain RIFCSPLOWO2_12_FULL_64_10) TaxID=1817868 RepID=A0A1F6C623_HANXR|nr:MAG: hypothetical protein A3F84_05510 [Candidatus Handelsmanbacteria bacterium RIFCSPLOWO2_12_FULL_64_10]
MRKKELMLCGLLAMLCVAWPDVARGQVRAGVRGGATIDPDQFHFGFHVQAVIVQQLRFQPNVEVGVGDNLTLIALNPELNYLFAARSPMKPYVGGGPGINVFDRRGPFGGTHTDVGVNFVFGIEVPLRRGPDFLAELKVGVGDTPDLKMTFGLTF